MIVDDYQLDPQSNPNLGRMLSEAATVMIWVANTEKECVYFNKAWLAFRGRTLAEEYDARWAEGIHPDDYERCLKIYHDAFEAREPFSMDYRLKRHDGEYRWIRDDGAPYFEPERGFMGYIGSCFDIDELVDSKNALQESDERFQLLVSGASDAFWIRSADFSKLEYVSPGFAAIWGVSAEELSVSPNILFELVHPEDKKNHHLQMRRCHEAGKAYECQYRIVLRDGQIKWINERGYPTESAGAQMFMAGVCSDITRQRQLEDRLLINEAGKLAQVGGVQINLTTQEMVWTAETYRIFQVDPADSVTIDDIFAKIMTNNRNRLREKFMSALRSRHGVSLELPLAIRFDKKGKWVRLTGEFIEREKDELYFYAAVQDITTQKLSDKKLRDKEARMHHLAHHDALTNIPNRFFFNNHLKACVARGKRYQTCIAVVLIDLDRFKVINDTLGHRIGDEFLKVIAQRLKTSIRQSDMAARIGGDEFALILENLQGLDTVIALVNKLLNILGMPMVIQKHELRSTASIGVSLFPRDGESPDILLKAADIAMFHAKNSGRNTYSLYRSSVAEQASELLTLEAELLKALDNNEFFVEYQPQCELVSGRIMGAEALVRWRHPQKGIIMPDVFIPIAEASGIILQLGRWILEESLRQFKSWLDAGKDLQRISVNLSARQFAQVDLPFMIGAALNRYGLQAERLELEITESLMMSDVDVTINHLQTLKSMGLHLSIDDFGTGYSSLSYLKRFSIDKLKIDKSFVRDIETDPNDAAISASIIALAHKMNLKVTAEGVENRQQVAFLKAHQCDEVQGYLYGRPMSYGQMMDCLGDQLEPA